MDSIDAQSLPREDTTASPDQAQEAAAGHGRRIHPLLADIDPADNRNQAVLADWLSDSELLKQPPAPRVAFFSITVAARGLNFLRMMAVHVVPANRDFSLPRVDFSVSTAAPGNATVDVPMDTIPSVTFSTIGCGIYVDVFFPGLANQGGKARSKVTRGDAELHLGHMAEAAAKERASALARYKDFFFVMSIADIRMVSRSDSWKGTVKRAVEAT
ncbi:hypothetical protein H4R18_002185, partial [Coemansia javaensis]